MHINFCFLQKIIPLLLFVFAAIYGEAQPKNVLLIMVDDLNDFVGAYGYPNVQTPNIDALSKKGVTFLQANAASPACNPSRTAMLTGLRPHRSGVLENAAGHFRDRPELQDVVTLPQYFRQNGYQAIASGKIFHSIEPPFPDTGFSWDTVYYTGPVWGNKWGAGQWTTVEEFRWMPTDAKTEETPDYLTAEAIAQFLGESHEKPFFAACGVFRPHLDWRVPKEYFDLYPLENIPIPPAEYVQDDLADLPESGMDASNHKLDVIRAAGYWPQILQAYLASVTYADVVVGRVLEALEKSPYRDNTIVVLAGDHGWHFGNKDHLKKFSLWERAVKTPLIIYDPETGVSGTCNKAVSLQDIYPTLIDLCDLPATSEVSGISLKPLLEDPENEKWQGYALTSYQTGHSLRNDHFRYIRYHDGSEELYDHRIDPFEFNNEAHNPTYNSEKSSMIWKLEQVLAGEDDPYQNYTADSVPNVQNIQHYSWPATIPRSDKYAVKAFQECNTYDLFSHYSEPNLIEGPDGHGVSEVLEDRSLSFVQFTFSGETEIEVTKLYGSLASRVEISPKSFGIEPTFFDGRKVRFTINEQHTPAYISVNFISPDNNDADGNGGKDILNGMMIFADRPGVIKPDSLGPGVVVYGPEVDASGLQNASIIYFPPGDFDLRDKFPETNGRLNLNRDGQRVYLAGGAFVRGSINANEHDGIWVYGHGIITGMDHPRNVFVDNGTRTAFLDFHGSKNSRLEGIVIANPTQHTCPSDEYSSIKNIKIIGWADNHDGIRPLSGSIAEEVFIKTNGDYDRATSQHIVRNSVIWPMPDAAFGLLSGDTPGTGFSKYKNLYFINSEWNEVQPDQGIIGSVLEQGVDLKKDSLINLYAENNLGLLVNMTIDYQADGKELSGSSAGEVSDFVFKNIILEKPFQFGNGTTALNSIRGFERNGTKASIKNMRFINLVAGNQLVTQENYMDFFEIDANTTDNISFTTEGSIYFINASTNPGGTVSPNGMVPTPSGMDRFLTIVPDEGKRIAEVWIDGINVGRLQNVFFPAIDADHTVSVVFESGEDYFGETTDPCQVTTVDNGPGLADTNFELFPNPAGKTVQIRGIEPNDRVRIFDQTGRLLMDRTNGSELSINEFIPGLYIVLINEEAVLRFIKQ